MSHRKFEHPRCGSLGFLPKKRCRKVHGKIRSFPKDDKTKPCHLTAYIGYKAGMTHIIREVDRPGSKVNKKEVCEAVTVIETPPLVGVGITGYIKTVEGFHSHVTLWAQNVTQAFRRRYIKNWNAKSFTPFDHPEKAYEDKKNIDKKLKKLKEDCHIIRLICHTQPSLLSMDRKKAHVMEIQINGGTIAEKVDYGYKLLEKKIPINEIFNPDEMIDCIAITKGKGREGVVTRWGVTRLPRKTHRGLRKVACIGAWHPSRVSWTVARAGQHGYHHRTQINNKIYKIGIKGKVSFMATTSFDVTNKEITPMGGFGRYGCIKEDYIIVKGCIPGPKKRAITLRKSLVDHKTKKATENINLKFISTASQMGHGRFQTTKEKFNFYGKVYEEPPAPPAPPPPADAPPAAQPAPPPAADAPPADTTIAKEEE